jgi:hypothetical protein
VELPWVATINTALGPSSAAEIQKKALGSERRSSIQIQRGDMGFLYANIVEAMDKAAVENAYRGDSGTSSRTVESGESASVPGCWLMALTKTQ